MADWSDISAPYSDAITQIFPIHRAAVFLGGLSASLSIEKSKESIVSAFLSFKLMDIANISTGFFKELTGLNLLAGLSAVLVAILLSKTLTHLIFNLINKATAIKQRTQDIDTNWAKELSIEDRKTALELIETATSEARNRLRTIAGFNELAAGFFSIVLVASACTGLIDFSISLVILAASVISHAMSLYVFINDYYGLAATKAQLLGKSVPSIGINQA